MSNRAYKRKFKNIFYKGKCLNLSNNHINKKYFYSNWATPCMPIGRELPGAIPYKSDGDACPRIK